TASFGGVGTGVAGTGSWIGKMLDSSVADALTPSPLGAMGTPFGDLTFSVDPVSLGVQAAWMVWQAYNAALACDEKDYKSTTKTNSKLCYQTGTWCEHKDCSIFGCTCTKFRTGKCCYNSKLSRIINQQGRPQLGLDMRDCGGFTVAQLQALDWSKIDLSEFIADMLAQAQAATANVVNNALPTLQNQTATITKSNAATGTQPNIPLKQ
nr:conjugal transfer protein TraN [Pseudomonadota bacterium]